MNKTPKKISDLPISQNALPDDVFYLVKNKNGSPNQISIKTLFGSIQTDVVVYGSFSISGPSIFNEKILVNADFDARALTLLGDHITIKNKHTPFSSKNSLLPTGAIAYDDNNLYVKTDDQNLKKVSLENFDTSTKGKFLKIQRVKNEISLGNDESGQIFLVDNIRDVTVTLKDDASVGAYFTVKQYGTGTVHFKTEENGSIILYGNKSRWTAWQYASALVYCVENHDGKSAVWSLDGELATDNFFPTNNQTIAAMG